MAFVEMLLILETCEMASSMGTAMASSISSAVAPE